ncbi:MAG TPA: DUF1634 domain-containing protein [Candidatus Limnocylindrales bacterium]|nr:DUF1634 domain-containing protein [Candidatus Limnocylindrales bacterium]
MTAGPRHAPALDLDRTVGRLLTIGTYASILLIAIGCVLMFAARIDPLAGGPALEPGLIIDDITHLRPAGFMWLGLVVLLFTPIARVVVSLFGYISRGERTMAIVSVLILVVIAASIVIGNVEA